MRGAGLDERQQIEVLPDLDQFALADLAHQHDRQIELRAWSWFLSRGRWPLIGDHSRMHVLPAEFRPLGIGEDVCGFDAQAVSVLPRGNGSCGQLPDLIDSTKRLTSGLDHPFGVGAMSSRKLSMSSEVNAAV